MFVFQSAKVVQRENKRKPENENRRHWIRCCGTDHGPGAAKRVQKRKNIHHCRQILQGNDLIRRGRNFSPRFEYKQRETADDNQQNFISGTSFSGPTEEITKKWVYDAYQHWDDIRKSAESSLAGVCQLSGYIFSSTSQSITRVSIFLRLISDYAN